MVGVIILHVDDALVLGSFNFIRWIEEQAETMLGGAEKLKRAIDRGVVKVYQDDYGVERFAISKESVSHSQKVIRKHGIDESKVVLIVRFASFFV